MAKTTSYALVVALPESADEVHELEVGTEMTVTVIEAPSTNKSLMEAVRKVEDQRNAGHRHAVLSFAVPTEAAEQE